MRSWLQTLAAFQSFGKTFCGPADSVGLALWSFPPTHHRDHRAKQCTLGKTERSSAVREMRGAPGRRQVAGGRSAFPLWVFLGINSLFSPASVSSSVKLRGSRAGHACSSSAFMGPGLCLSGELPGTASSSYFSASPMGG